MRAAMTDVHARPGARPDAQPARAILAALTTLYQPNYIDILPMFIWSMAALSTFAWLEVRVGIWAARPAADPSRAARFCCGSVCGGIAAGTGDLRCRSKPSRPVRAVWRELSSGGRLGIDRRPAASHHPIAAAGLGLVHRGVGRLEQAGG